jgi:hypothetical protein
MVSVGDAVSRRRADSVGTLQETGAGRTGRTHRSLRRLAGLSGSQG